MPYCKNCGSRITKFEKDICPICGTKHPLDGATSDTVEITTELNVHEKGNGLNYKAHYRITTFVLFAFLGWTGAGFFYLNFKKLGLIWLLCNLAVIGGAIGLFILTIGVTNWLSYVAPFAIVYLINMGLSLYYLFKNDIKDGNGEFIH